MLPHLAKPERDHRAHLVLQITLVAEGIDLDQPIRRLLAVDEVATVHVRAVQSQCFAYSVTR